jgi:hypothetical protein
MFLRVDFREFRYTAEFISQQKKTKKKTKNKKSSATGGAAAGQNHLNCN